MAWRVSKEWIGDSREGGGNCGVTLRHNYVVLGLIGPLNFLSDATANQATLLRGWRLPAGAVVKNRGVAAFVQSDKGEVMPAMALPVCRA